MAEKQLDPTAGPKIRGSPPFRRDLLKIAAGAELIMAVVFYFYRDSRIAQLAFICATLTLLAAVMRRTTPGFATAKQSNRPKRVPDGSRNDPTAADVPPTRDELLRAREDLEREIDTVTRHPELVERLQAMIDEIDESLANMGDGGSQ